MKVNYENEFYSQEIFNIIIYIFLILFILFWGNCLVINMETYVIMGIFILPLIILLFVSVKRYIKMRHRRKVNLNIINKGDCLSGRLISIYDNYTIFESGKCSHNVTAEIEYYIDNKREKIVVDHLLININKLEKYFNKEVKLYCYENMCYVDILN